MSKLNFIVREEDDHSPSGNYGLGFRYEDDRIKARQAVLLSEMDSPQEAAEKLRYLADLLDMIKYPKR